MAPGRSAAEVPVIPLGTAVASLMGFGTSLISYHTQIPSPYEWKRVKPEYVVGLVFGRFTFLTYQTIVIGTIFSLIAFAAAIGYSVLDPLVRDLFPLVFTVGFFLTPAHYGLNHWNPAQILVRQEWAQLGYAHGDLAVHLQHAPATPLTVLLALTITSPASAHPRKDRGFVLSCALCPALWPVHTCCVFLPAPPLVVWRLGGGVEPSNLGVDKNFDFPSPPLTQVSASAQVKRQVYTVVPVRTVYCNVV